MANCPNCGRETLRTEDWACQWCGHPLLHGPFKRIEKTYRQLKDERIGKSIREEEIGWGLKKEMELEKEIEPKQDLAVVKGIKLEPEPETGKKMDIVQSIEQETEIETEAVIEAEPEEKVDETEPESIVEKETEPAKAEETGKEVKAEPEEEIASVKEVVEEAGDEEIGEYEQETKPEIEEETELIEEPEQEPEPADMELTVGEILEAYEENDVAADEKFMNKILRVTGKVSLVDVKDKLAIHYIRLTGGGGDPWQNLQCMFDKKYSSLLEQLEKGQTVTVQGIYRGSVIAIRMVDCVLVK